MIFVDYLGPSARFAEVRGAVALAVSAAFHMPLEQVVVRRIVTEDDQAAVELWIELSSDEQLYRRGRQIAQQVTEAVRTTGGPEQVWVMYRVVPLSHAFLNGEPRSRGAPSFE